MPIQILSQDVVAQIAAGEVVERPSSVVKELLENSIDAGATEIAIDIVGDGRRKIQISDDGCGIRQEEAAVAFARHATSKLCRADDLYAITTLGFRGEALASIASVSQVSLITRHADEDAGTHIRLEAGAISGQRPIGAPQGTTLTVEHLFFNTPARLKFLKNETTEKRAILQIVTRYAIAYPHIRFTLTQDGREALRTHGTGQLLDVLVSTGGLDQVKNMFEVADESKGVAVTGYTSSPSFNRSDRTRITLFVNGRWIQDTAVTYAVVQAYHTLLMTGRYPVAVLLLQVPPADVDVNVHPTKAEVRFKDPDAVFSAVQRAVRRAVIHQAESPALRARFSPQTRGEAVWNPELGPTDTDPQRAAEYAAQMRLGMNLDAPGQPARRQYEREGGEADGQGGAAPGTNGAPQRPRTLPMLRVIGQIAAGYIVAEGPAGLYLVDQHAAHERVLYEQHLDEYEKTGTVAQMTLSAQTVQTSAEEALLLMQHLDMLASLGFAIEPFGPNVFVIRGIPAMLTDADPSTVVASILEDLERGAKPGEETVQAKILRRVCKQAAVKAGQILSAEQMQGILRQLERCRVPLTCPHGRPTMIHMSADQLAREFGRITG
jgi:DNA mismatch repair protein MutL